MRYLKSTWYMKRHLSADNLTNLMWWVDDSYGVHWDSKGHTGVMMSTGKGAIVNVSRRHKLNVGSSIESGLVSITDVLGVMIWCKYFMETQDYTIDNNLSYQDSKLTILLSKNGRMSAGKASRHIHHRFFLVTDKIEKGDVSVEHRQAEEMWVDGNTKPLQGAGFRLFRSKVMGIPEDYDDDAERVRTHPQLLPKPKEAEVVPSEDLEVLAKALGVQGPDHNRQKGSTPPVTPVQSGGRSVLDSMKFGPENRPYWEMKEGRSQPWYLDLIKVLKRESDPSRRRHILARHKTRILGSSRGTVQLKVFLNECKKG